MIQVNRANFEEIYDSADSFYQSFWDSEGSLHWGYFEDPHSTTVPIEEFPLACKRWNEYMLERSQITGNSRVLDVGCGNGNTAIWLAQETGCEVVGIDLSGVRINNAKVKAQEHPSLKISFEKASATELPFEEGSFTHVWSQATIYHIYERQEALRELYRTIAKGGFLVFDDLITPIPIEKISETSRKWVYERIHFQPLFSGESYVDFLEEIGFKVWEAEYLSAHYKTTYQLVCEKAKAYISQVKASPGDSAGGLPDINAYEKMCAAISGRELGCYFYLCQKT